MQKKASSLFLVLVLLCTFVSPVWAEEPIAQNEPKRHILLIGNSYTRDAFQYLGEIFRDAGSNDTIAFAYVGSRKLTGHLESLNKKTAEYVFQIWENGKRTNKTKQTLENVLKNGNEDKTWDVIALQQQSSDAGIPSSYQKDNVLDDYTAAILNLQPKADLKWYMTWAYAGSRNLTTSVAKSSSGSDTDDEDEDLAGYAAFGYDQTTMYNAICSTVQSVVGSRMGEDGVFSEIVPIGTAIQNARTSCVGDTFNADGTHLGPIGCYLNGLTWFAALTGKDLADFDPKTPGEAILGGIDPAIIPQIYWPLLKESATNALARPFEFTKSKVTSLPLDAANATIPSAVYTGAAVYPKPTVTLGAFQWVNASTNRTPVYRVLLEDDGQTRDYGLAYSGNLDVGEGFVTLTGHGFYTGTLTVPFEITPMAAGDLLVDDISNIAYTGKEIKPNAVVYNNDSLLVKNTDYTVSYANNTAVGKATMTIAGKGNFQDKQTVSFQIVKRHVATLKTSKLKAYTYNGKAKKPKIKVKYGSKTLKKNKDYKIAYEDNIEGGKASIVVTGLGNYTGTVRKYFTIKPVSLSKCKLSVGVGTNNFFGAIPDLKLTRKNKTLEKDLDYTVTAQNNTKTGIGTFVVEGKGSFYGKRTGSFVVAPGAGTPSITRTGNMLNLTFSTYGEYKRLQVQTADDIECTQNTQVVTAQTGKLQLPVPGRVRYVRVRAIGMVGGQEVSGGWTNPVLLQ